MKVFEDHQRKEGKLLDIPVHNSCSFHCTRDLS
jgi:hypothetical protein